MTDERDGEQLLLQLGRRARRHWETATAHRLRAHDDDLAGAASSDLLIARVIDRIERPPERGFDDAPRSYRWVPMLMVVAATVIALLWWRPGPTPAASIPEYQEVSFEGGLHPIRAEAPAEAGETPRFDGAALLRWRLAPQTAVGPEVDVRIDAAGPDHRCLAVTQGQRIMATGAIELLGSVDELLGLPPGTWTLTVLVGSKAQMAALDDPCARSEGGAWSEGVRAAGSRRIVIDPRAR